MRKLFVLAPLGVLAALLLFSGPRTEANTITSPDTTGSVAAFTSLALDSSGNPVVSYYDGTNGDLKLLHCGNATCTAGNTITSPDTLGNVGSFASLVLDTSGNPLVSYNFSPGFADGDLRVLHCGDATCSAGNTIASPDTANDTGFYLSLALDGSGNPVVSYLVGSAITDLKVLHCGNATCTVGNTIASPDTAGEVGFNTSLALDALGNPVVSYYDASNFDLKVLHCGNPACTAGNSITSPDTAGNVGFSTSLALDSSGNPVVSYYDATSGDLKVLHCDDPNCTGGGESITAPDAAGLVGGGPSDYYTTSLALDAGGNPVVSYWDGTSLDLKVLHCNDANCAGGGDSITSPDTAGNVGQAASLVLDGSGNPVVSYWNRTNGALKVLHCSNSGCLPEDIWSPAGSMVTARNNHPATLLPNGKVLVAGGGAAFVGALASAELYDPVANTWSSAAGLAEARQVHTATLLQNGKVLVAGGERSCSNCVVANAELYDPVANTWSPAGSLATARRHHTATLLASGKVLVAGGFGAGVLASAELYDPVANTWSPAGSMATARNSHRATLLPDGKVLVTGGNDGVVLLASAELYDPVANIWSPAASLASARDSHTATLLPDGKVLVAGGNGASILASAELYDPVANTWSAAGTMATARGLHTATLLPNGMVLAAGGEGGGSLASAELYDPVANTWSTAASMATARHSHTATLLSNGKVLAAGGQGGAATLASAELYTPCRDSDGDSWSNCAEASIGTNPLLKCGTNGNPADFNNDNFFDITDIAEVAGSFGQAVPPGPAREDIAPDPPDGFVDISDIGAVAGRFGQPCT